MIFSHGRSGFAQYSHFIPEHFGGATYEGRGPVYARQHWGSTRRSYDTLHQQEMAA